MHLSRKLLAVTGNVRWFGDYNLSGKKRKIIPPGKYVGKCYINN